MPMPTQPPPSTHFRTCTLCEAMCGLAIETDGARVLGIRGDRDDPFSRGHICPKGVALQDIHTDPDRLRHPVRRTGSGWERVGWDEALDYVAFRLRSIGREHGRDAVAVYQGNPTVHNLGSMLFAPGFVRALGTRNRFSATSVDQLPHHFLAYLMFGHQLLVPIPDIDRTQFMLVLGANPAVSNGSLMSAPDAAGRLRAIRARGGTVVVVDPRRTETAALADRHLFVRPGTDALLLMALLHTVFAERLDRPGRLAAFTDGLDAVRAAVAAVTPERAAPVTGIGADTIRGLARDFAAAPSAVCYGRFGVSTQEFGAVAHWLINVLNLVTGNLDRPGGAMFTSPAVDAVERSRPGGYARWRSRVRSLPEFGGELPVSVLAEEILTPGDGQVRALVTSAGNPVLSTPNGGQLDRALARLEFMVSVDFYVNETTRHAHIILPPTSPLEHEHYDLAFYLLSVRNAAKFSPPLFDAPAGALHDWQIFLGLRERMERGWKARLRLAGLRRLGPEGMLDLGLRTGPYGAGMRPWGGGLSLRRLKRHPHGIDLGPLHPVLPGRLRTPARRIDAAPAPVLADLQRLRARLLASAADPSADTGTGAAALDLLLIGRRQLRSNNSWMHNVPRLVRGRNRCTLLIHPDDAAARRIADGDAVRLVSRTGSVDVPAEVTDAVMSGVVSLPHGWGHGRDGVQARVAQAHAGASVNDVTDDRFVDALSGNAALNGVPVRVERAPRDPSLEPSSTGSTSTDQTPMTGRAPAPLPTSPEPAAAASLIPVDGSPLNAETPLSALAEVPTRPDLFYVRSNFPVPTLDRGSWRLDIGGAVDRPASLSWAELRAFARHEGTMTMECAGNGRRLMEVVPSGTPWTLGAVSTARFAGAPLAAVLERVGVGADAAEVLFVGADGGEVEPGRTVGFERSLPLAAALNPDVLLAWEMNGEPLAPEHGSPVRLVVPGWYGMASVKWLVGVRVLTEPFRGHFQTERYVYMEEDGVPDGTPVTRIRVRALTAFPADGAVLPLQVVRLVGTAWSGDGEIRRVEVSTDGGGSWSDAVLEPPGTRHTATVWSLEWTPPGPGRFQIVSRATDAAGNRQPLEPLRNTQGYGNNVVQRIAVHVR